MTDFEKQEKFLLVLFREFHEALERLKASARAGNYVYSKEQMNKMSATEREDKTVVSSNRIFQELVTLFEGQQIKAERSGNEMGSKLYNEALFIMAAIADEIFLTMSWSGQEAWSKFLLETKFFGSNAGGDIFFDRLEAILKERDPVYSELATMYLLALSLGFRGKFHGINDSGAIEDYKEQLYTFIFQNQPDLTAVDKTLFPNAYLNTLTLDSKMMIPGLKKWYGFVALLVVSLVGISHIIWLQMTYDINKIVTQILGG